MAIQHYSPGQPRPVLAIDGYAQNAATAAKAVHRHLLSNGLPTHLRGSHTSSCKLGMPIGHPCIT
jgi:hypothetical protein